MNNQITAERLANLAKAMGKLNPEIRGNSVIYYKWHYHLETAVYWPHENWNQCGDLLKWLLEQESRPAMSLLKGEENKSFIEGGGR